MKNKEAKKPILQQDLVKYCEQIGIREPPKLVFSLGDMDKICDHKWDRNRNKALGACCRDHGIIAVDLTTPRSKVWRVTKWVKHPKDHPEYSSMKYCKWVRWGLREARYVLVHELVHYRWESMDEGRRQWLRTREVLAGRRFDPPEEIKPSPIIETKIKNRR